MKVMAIPIFIVALGTIPKGLEEFESGVRAETIQTTALLKLARILKSVLETCCHSDSSERPSDNAGEKNSKEKL